MEDSSYLSSFNLLNQQIDRVKERDIIDSDLIIIDVENIHGTLAVQGYSRLASYLQRRIKAGGLLVVFSDAPQSFQSHYNYNLFKNLFIPNKCEVSSGSGKEIAEGSSKRLYEIFYKYKKVIEWRYHFIIYNMFPILLNNAREVISCTLQYDNGTICFLPKILEKSRFTDDFLPALLGELKPNFDYSVVKGECEPAPAWLTDFQVEGAEVLVSKLNGKEEEISKLQEERDSLSKEIESLDEYRDLLWQTGDWLEFAVKKFFKLLGFECEKEEPIDLVGNYDGREILIEIEGSEKAIKLEKGRQILQRVVDAKNPANAKGVLVGNPFRKESPATRPPEKQTFFVSDVEELAEGHNISLVLTIDMFEVVQEILRGEKVDKPKILKKIFENKGLIRLNK